MVKEIAIKVQPKDIGDMSLIESKVKKKLAKVKGRLTSIEVFKRSVDARGKVPVYFVQCRAYFDEQKPVAPSYISKLNRVSGEKKVIIIGAGPAGYFAALRCLELGMTPIVYDRGKDVRQRRRDLKAIQQEGVVNENSNYCFGEGGAGTYSDGKLYTRSKKRGSVKKILEILIDFGAKSDIGIDAHPHIGSNKLPKIVANIRDHILEKGGEIHFNQKVIDIVILNKKVDHIILESGEQVRGESYILATGHSARDIYTLCDERDITMEAKPFSLGVRMEHPQPLIDEIQYNQRNRSEHLPASSYSLACHLDEVGVFSFCMCPGGLIVPASTSPGELVVNGMSLSRRDSPYANAGTVVSISLKDLDREGYRGIFACLDFQRDLERKFFDSQAETQKAPAQLLTDYLAKKTSVKLNNTSYIPGIYAAPIHEMLPPFVDQSLRRGIEIFGKKMKGYITNEAQIIGLESRTSSPIRIPRDAGTLQHVDISNLFPCGEGAGYAGGIMSAAIDGQNVATAIYSFLSDT